MKKNNSRNYVLTTEEMIEINRVISPAFGERNRVTSGSYYMVKGKVTQCNITIGETNTYKSETMLKRIGQKVKEVLGADEVYSFGTKLA